VAEQRYQAVLAVISDGLSVSQVAEKVGVSRQTLHTWLARAPFPPGKVEFAKLNSVSRPLRRTTVSA
jgi:hypothetical protein